jgi:hypothetical protein
LRSMLASNSAAVFFCSRRSMPARMPRPNNRVASAKTVLRRTNNRVASAKTV